jgi:hypothetical protein
MSTLKLLIPLLLVLTTLQLSTMALPFIYLHFRRSLSPISCFLLGCLLFVPKLTFHPPPIN